MLAYDIDADIAWFNANIHDLAEKYAGRTLAIRNGEILAVGDSLAEVAGRAGYSMGEFLVRRSLEGGGRHMARIRTPGVVGP